MVLRGSGIKPKSSLTDLEDHLLELEEKIDYIQKQIQIQVLRLRRLGKIANDEGFENVNDEFERCLHTLDSLDLRLRTTTTLKVKTENMIWLNIQTLFAGGIATGSARTLCAPIDRVKVFLQTNPDCGGVVSVVRHIIKDDGIRGFWRGNAVNVSRVFFKGGLQFVVYDDFKKRLKDIIGNKTWGSKLTCAVLGALTVSTTLHPIDLLRLRCMRDKSLTIADFCKSTFRNEGLLGFYNGYISSLVATAPFFSIQFATTDYLKQHFHVQTGSWKIIFLGGASSILASCCCYPTDTVNKKVLSAKKSEGVTITSILRGVAQNPVFSPNGFIGLYRGFSMNCLKVAPQTGIRFWLCDVILQKWGVSRNRD